MRVVAAVAVALVLTGCGASATSSGDLMRTGASARVGDLELTGGYVPAPASPSVAAAYVTIHNTGRTADTLESVRADVASSAQVDHYVARDGAQQMVPQGPLPIPAGATVRMHPGGYHIMLMDPRNLTKGDRVTLTLSFARAGTVSITEPVVAATGLP